MVATTNSEIGNLLPYLRRFARAMTGSQLQGDSYAAAALQAILDDQNILKANLPLRVALFRVMYSVTPSLTSAESGSKQFPDKSLAQLTSVHRSALLMHTIEDLSLAEIAEVMDISRDEVSRLISQAQFELLNAVIGKIMIIEDEAVIAMGLETIVTDQGHDVIGIARTRQEAVSLSAAERPDLILADIRLADHSSGIDAVHEILTGLGTIPVIFITAFPELLLTGESPEPVFVIRKPFIDAQVHSAVSQAMFFRSSANIQPIRTELTPN